MPSKDTVKKTNIKRLPEHSYTIIFQFESKKIRDKCINSEDFQGEFAEMAKLLINYNCRIELIKWDFLLGKSSK